MEILKQLDESVEDLKELRNKVAHQEGYSTKNMIVIQAIENFNSESREELTNFMPLERIKEIVKNDVVSDFTAVLPKMNQLVHKLIDSLSFVYRGLLEKYITKKG